MDDDTERSSETRAYLGAAELIEIYDDCTKMHNVAAVHVGALTSCTSTFPAAPASLPPTTDAPSLILTATSSRH